jgi:hypothetical protein
VTALYLLGGKGDYFRGRNCGGGFEPVNIDETSLSPYQKEYNQGYINQWLDCYDYPWGKRCMRSNYDWKDEVFIYLCMKKESANTPKGEKPLRHVSLQSTGKAEKHKGPQWNSHTGHCGSDSLSKYTTVQSYWDPTVTTINARSSWGENYYKGLLPYMCESTEIKEPAIQDFMLTSKNVCPEGYDKIENSAAANGNFNQDTNDHFTLEGAVFLCYCTSDCMHE